MRIGHFFLELLIKLNGIIKHFPPNCHVDIRTRLKNTTLEGFNMIKKGSSLVDCKVGYASFIGRNCSFNRVKIGKYCSVGEDVRLIYGNHPVDKIVSTYPAFYSKEAQYGLSYVSETIFKEYTYTKDGFNAEIGNDVWIGSFVRILGGITIGDGAIIGANALVTTDVPPYSVVVGVPAKCMKMRFSKEQIEKLRDIQWWNMDKDWLKQNAELFSDIDFFLENVNSDDTKK